MEDAVPCVAVVGDCLICAVADGMTRKVIQGYYPDPSPAFQAATLAVGSCTRFLAERLKEETYETLLTQKLLNKAVCAANASVGKLNQQLHLYKEVSPKKLHKDLAATSLTVIVLKPEPKGKSHLYFGHITDSRLLVGNGKRGLRLLTPTQTARVTTYKRRVRQNAPFLGQGRSDDHARFMYRLTRNNSDPSNDLCWGALTGEKNAELYITTGEAILAPEDAVLLMTDATNHVDNITIASCLSSIPYNQIFSSLFSIELMFHQFRKTELDPDFSGVLISPR
ncbi:protein phosphatase 2C domain-containing protein, partial [Candidatus Microgenomates bacterium]|nr:protein phosphatase 2C domain-containing protein [Candidatus Microgenomates bacterium]